VSSLSDPGRPSRGDRRSVQKLIDAAYAGGLLSAAERALRTQRVDAAHTRGDLAMIARDLRTPADGAAALPEPDPVVVQDLQAPTKPQEDTPSLGSAIDPQLLQSMQVGGAYRGTGAAGTARTINLAGFANAARTIRIVILVVVLGFVGICGLGMAALVPAFLEGFDSGPTSSQTAIPADVATTQPGPSGTGPVEQAASTNLHSAAGWKALVAAIEDKSGSSSVYDLVVYPTYAAVGLDGGKSIERGFYRDGGWQDSIDVRTPIVGSPVDLRKIDPKLIEKLPADAAQRLGIESVTGTYLIVNAIPSDPKIMVYIQFDGGSNYQTYTLDGTPREF
jgi:hypothetical protein